MLETQTFADQSQGVDFDIHVKTNPNGFTYNVIIHFDGLELPVNDEKLYSSIDDARNAGQKQAWGIIDQLKKRQG